MKTLRNTTFARKVSFRIHIDQVDPFPFQPALQHFVNDKFPPKAETSSKISYTPSPVNPHRLRSTKRQFTRPSYLDISCVYVLLRHSRVWRTLEILFADYNPHSVCPSLQHLPHVDMNKLLYRERRAGGSFSRIGCGKVGVRLRNYILEASLFTVRYL